MTHALIVDDRDDGLYYLSALLTGHGWTVEQAHHGAEALTKARLHPPDLVVSDLLMPVMDGYMLLHYWKADKRLRLAPFVVYTATYTEAKDEELALSLGADAFILKPAEPEELLALLGQVLGRGSVARPAVEERVDGPESPTLKLYSQTLIRKLEEKTLELEEANRALQQDVARRVEMEEALRRSEAEFRQLAEAMPQIVWATRSDGWVVYFNPQWIQYTGLTPDQSLGDGWSKPFHPEDRKLAWEAWQHALATATSYSVEARLRRADGTYRWWLIRGLPLRDASGAVLKWFGTCTDIHDLRLAERRISESEDRFAKVFQSSLVALSIASRASGRLIDINDAYCEFFGYTRDEMIGGTVFDLGLWVDPLARSRLIADLVRSNEVSRVEAQFRHKSGEVRHALVSMQTLNLAGTEEDLVMLALVDITERRQLELRLLQAQKIEAVGRLAGGVAHDFNNVLGVILGYAELLMRHASDSQRGRLEQILKATERGSALTRQLLAFSRKQVVEPKVLDLNALVADLEKMVRRLIGEDVELAMVPGPDLGQIRADGGQLDQVVMNLCVNARDAMPDGGLLRIETANVEIATTTATNGEPIPPGRYVMLSVGDSGSGIDKAILPNIFEPFFTTKEQGKGTGLGLSTVHGIVKQSGGYVWVYSELRQGTTFEIYLPRVDELVAAKELREPSLPPPGSETILLVEDEEALRSITREILEAHGYRVLDASGVDEAVAIGHLHPSPIHLLLTDVVMPGMNGRQLADVLKKLRPDLGVLYMSGYTDDVIVHRGVLEPGIQLLVKPFTGASLIERVHHVLRARGKSESP